MARHPGPARGRGSIRKSRRTSSRLVRCQPVRCHGAVVERRSCGTGEGHWPCALEPIMSGDVGIFWVDHGQLIMAAVPLAEGIDDGRFVNGPYDHDPYWGTVQRSHKHL